MGIRDVVVFCFPWINFPFPIKKPWVDDDEDANEELPTDAHLPGRIRGLTNRQARVRMARAELMSGGDDAGDGGGTSTSIQQQSGTLLAEAFTPSPTKTKTSSRPLANGNSLADAVPIYRPTTRAGRESCWWHRVRTVHAI